MQGQSHLFPVSAGVSETVSRAWSPVAQGAYAELLLATRLLELGHRVARPIVDDDGVDLIVDYHLTVQVKSGRYRRADGALNVNLRAANSQDRRRYGTRALGAHVDVLAVLAADSGVWWHIPTSELTAGAVGLCVSEAYRRGPSLFRDAWEVYDR